MTGLELRLPRWVAAVLWLAREPLQVHPVEVGTAIAELQSAEAQAMFGFARRQGLTDDQVDDVVQEVFARLLREQRRGVVIANPRSWTYQTLYIGVVDGPRRLMT